MFQNDCTFTKLILLCLRQTTFGNEICNWEDINVETILNIVKDRLDKHYFIDSKISKNDRLILHISEKNI